jgi:hypothetical protein
MVKPPGFTPPCTLLRSVARQPTDSAPPRAMPHQAPIFGALPRHHVIKAESLLAVGSSLQTTTRRIGGTDSSA